jgi:hypothetical protein
VAATMLCRARRGRQWVWRWESKGLGSSSKGPDASHKSHNNPPKNPPARNKEKSGSGLAGGMSPGPQSEHPANPIMAILDKWILSTIAVVMYQTNFASYGNLKLCLACGLGRRKVIPSLSSPYQKLLDHGEKGARGTVVSPSHWHQDVLVMPRGSSLHPWLSQAV